MSTKTGTIQRMWDTRPPRIPSDQGGNAKIAGVCEGIGVRYQIDPTLVRVVFVVSAFPLGGGVAAYLLAWLCMPRYGMSTSPLQVISRRSSQVDEPTKRERSTGFILAAVFLGMLLASSSGDSGVFSSVIGSVLLLFLAWYGLHSRAPQPPAGLLADPPEHTMPQAVDLSTFSPANGAPPPPGHSTPPEWDPLGTVPFAWHLPDPSPAPAPKPKARIWPWVVGGLGATLVVAALVVGGLWTAFYYHDSDVAGNRSYTPTSAVELEDRYTSSVGKTTVDLRQLGELDNSEHVEVTGGVGTLDVYLPENIPIELACESGLGNLICDSGTYNKDAAGETLSVSINSGIGNTEVHVGAQTRD